MSFNKRNNENFGDFITNTNLSYRFLFKGFLRGQNLSYLVFSSIGLDLIDFGTGPELCLMLLNTGSN